MRDFSFIYESGFVTNRLKEIMAIRNISEKELAVKLETTLGSVSRYLHGSRTPNAYTIAKLSLVLDVSADYLLGLKEFE